MPWSPGRQGLIGPGESARQVALPATLFDARQREGLMGDREAAAEATEAAMVDNPAPRPDGDLSLQIMMGGGLATESVPLVTSLVEREGALIL